MHFSMCIGWQGMGCRRRSFFTNPHASAMHHAAFIVTKRKTGGLFFLFFIYLLPSLLFPNPFTGRIQSFLCISWCLLVSGILLVIITRPAPTVYLLFILFSKMRLHQLFLPAVACFCQRLRIVSSAGRMSPDASHAWGMFGKPPGCSCLWDFRFHIPTAVRLLQRICMMFRWLFGRFW